MKLPKLSKVACIWGGGKLSLVAALAIPGLVCAEQGLVAHFTFDDAASWGYDSVRQAEIGTIYSYTNYNMASEAAAPGSISAPIVRGMNFANGWWYNGYMEVPGSSFGSAHGIPCGNQPVTYSLWIKPATGWQTGGSLGLGTQCLLLRHAASGHEWYQIYDHENIYIVKDGTTGFPTIAFGVGQFTTDAATAKYTLPAAFDGGWHFIAATYANRKLVLYYDGAKVAETELTGDVGLPDNSPLIFGTATSGYDAYCRDRYCGGVDDIKVYSRALNAAEVLAAYNAGAVAHDTDVISWIGATAGGAVENIGNWETKSNRRTVEEIYAAGPVMDVTAVYEGGVLTHGANATLALRGAICTNGQSEVTLRMQAGALALKRPSAQRGLVAHFSFDDSSNLLLDSGFAELAATTNVWTYNNTESAALPIQMVDGVNGKAMYFPANGQWSYWPSYYMQTTAATTTKANGIPCGGDPVSYSLWIKPYAAGLWDMGMMGLADRLIWIFRRGSWGNGNATYLWLGKGSGGGKLLWSIADYIGSDGTCAYEPSNLFDGNWHNVVCTYVAQTLNLYYDGTKVATTTASYPLAVSDGAPINLGDSEVGGNLESNYRRYLGGYDEFKVFNVALTDAEVAAEYVQRSRTLETNSVGTVPSPVKLVIDSGVSATVRGYGHEYGSASGVGSLSVGGTATLALDGMYALSGALTGSGDVTAANLTLGGDAAAYTGDFTVAENARIVITDDRGTMLNSTFGGKIKLPKKAVIVWGNRKHDVIACITASEFDLPSDFSEWKDMKRRNVSVRLVGDTLRIKVDLGGFNITIR